MGQTRPLSPIKKGEEANALRMSGISPSAQRVAVAGYVLHTEDHPSADEVWNEVLKTFPHISRATVYNTLNLFVEKGLLRQLVLTEGCVVFDPRMERHHHFIDEDSGRIHDIPWNAINVAGVGKLHNFEVHEYQLVMRGKRSVS